MKTEAFKKLLTDLYNKYNPGKVSDVERMATQYNGREFDAIKTIYLKYNFKQSDSYDKNLGSDSQIKELINKYDSDGSAPEEIKEEEQIVPETKEEPVINKIPFEINLKFNFPFDDLVIPDLYNFLFVSTNQRLLLKTKDGALVGVEVIDIMDSYLEERPTRDIIMNKI